MTVLHVHPANAILFSTLMASTRVAPPMMALSSRQSPKVILGMLTDTVGGMLSDDLSSSLAADEETFVVDQLPAPLERIALSADSDAAQKWARAAEEDACALLGAAGLDDGEQLSLTLTDDPAIRELNAQWRAVDAPTDVLSFPMDDPQLLGDLVISIDTAGRQAKERSHSIRDELRVRAEENHEPPALLSFSCIPSLSILSQILMVHGVLHLLGYDHETSNDEHTEMAAAERKLLTRLGWSGVGLIDLAEAQAEVA